MAESDFTRDLPPDLAALLRDQSVIVPQHAAVFEAVAAWAKAPNPTGTVQSEPTPHSAVVVGSTTPGRGC